MQMLMSLEQEGLSHADARAELPNRVPAGGIALAAGGGPGFARGSLVDPCQVCHSLIAELGMDPRVFVPGIEPFHTPAPKPGFWQRWFGRGPRGVS